MLETAFTQLRYGLSLAFGRRIRIENVRRMVYDIVATQAEFGPLSRDQADMLQGAALSAESRQFINERRLRRIARAACKQTAYYRELFGASGISPEDVTFDGLADLPVTPKEDLRALPEAFVSCRVEPSFLALTTGTTGPPTSVWFSRYEIELGVALGAVGSVLSLGYTPEDVIQVNISSRATLALVTTLGGCQLIGCPCAPIGLIDPDESLSRLVTPLRLPGKKPLVSILAAYPSYVGALVERAEAAGYGPRDFGLERILCGGEILTQGLRRRAEALFGASITEGFLMTEIYPLGGLLCRQGHIHLSPEQGLMEVLGLDDLRPAGHGEAGVLVATPFFPYRETTLLFRYATGDVVRLLDGATLTCEMAALPAVSPVLGKASHCPEVDGRRIFTRDILEVLESDPAVPLPARYAVERDSDGISLHVMARSTDPRVAARLGAAAEEGGLPLRRLRLHDSLNAMPPPVPTRAELTEATFTRPDGRRTVASRPTRMVP
jgi:phenylacetate-CoA ligase